MSIQNLRDLKKINPKMQTEIFYPYLIVGQNFFTLACLHRFHHHNVENVKIIKVK